MYCHGRKLPVLPSQHQHVHDWYRHYSDEHNGPKQEVSTEQDYPVSGSIIGSCRYIRVKFLDMQYENGSAQDSCS